MTKNNGTIFHIKMHHQRKANNNANFGNQVNVKTTSVSENWKIFLLISLLTLPVLCI